MIENKSWSNADRKVAGHAAIQIFQQPHEILTDPGMSLDEKRALLASWASDAHAVPGAPSLRQLEDGSCIEVQDILQALKSLDSGHGIDPSRKQPKTLWLRPLERRRLPTARAWPRISRHRSRDDDDDPPPCPAYAVTPPKHGGGGAFAFPETASA